MRDSTACLRLAAAALTLLVSGLSFANPPAATSAAEATERRGTELGFAVFQQHCVACHGNPAYERAPSPATLRTMSPERIYAALTSGVMKTVGDTLTEEDRRRVSESLAGQLLGSDKQGDAANMPNRCKSDLPFRAAGRADWNGWGNGAENNRFQPAAVAGLTAASVPHLKLKWAFGYPGGTSAYGQPAVVSGRVFVGTDTGYVYSLDARTGCVYWSFRAGAGVRNAMTVGPVNTDGKVHSAVFFGDAKATAYAIDARTGIEIWKTRVEENFTTRIAAGRHGVDRIERARGIETPQHMPIACGESPELAVGSGGEHHSRNQGDRRRVYYFVLRRGVEHGAPLALAISKLHCCDAARARTNVHVAIVDCRTPHRCTKLGAVRRRGRIRC